MTKEERYKLVCDIKRRIHIFEGKLKSWRDYRREMDKDIADLLAYLEIIEDEADALVVNGNKGGGDGR